MSKLGEFDALFCLLKMISYLLIAPSWSFVGIVDERVDSCGTVGGDGPFI